MMGIPNRLITLPTLPAPLATKEYLDPLCRFLKLLHTGLHFSAKFEQMDAQDQSDKRVQVGALPAHTENRNSIAANSAVLPQ